MMSSPQRLYLMQVADVPDRNIPIVCYLVQTDDGKNILIDSGLPDEFTPPPGFNPVMGKNVLEQLALLNLQPSDIQTVICTHFDTDHCGHLVDFPDAEFIVQQTHYEHAKTSPRFAGRVEQWQHLNFRCIEGDMELLPGLTLLRTDGHTLGHQSVLVALPENTILLAIDAVSMGKSFTLERQPGPMDEDVNALLASTQKLLEIAARPEVSLTVFGHDGDQWKSLKKLPEYYG
jgi:N-acyl homoserine lactone hydrolase